MAEWRIGEIKQVNGEWYQCIESHSSCEGCDFKNTFKCSYTGTKCSFPVRQDHTSVIFKKLEKVGVPYHNSEKKLCQQYKCYINPLVTDEIVYVFADNRAVIEIKQNKEDMEGKTNLYEKQTPLQKLMEIYCDGRMDYNEFEKKVKELYSDKGDDSKPILKPFDLEEAKAGKPVCTRDGRRARIICFDKKCLDEQVLIVLVDCGKEECMYFYTTDGKCIDDFSSFDLMMLPEKKEGWVNIYRGQVYNAFEKAEEARKIAKHGGDNCLKTIKINWEE